MDDGFSTGNVAIFEFHVMRVVNSEGWGNEKVFRILDSFEQLHNSTALCELFAFW